MAAGYLDLLQRELRDTVVHPFADQAALLGHPGIDGQMASVQGGFYVFANGAWRKVIDERDLALIDAALSRSATVYTISIGTGAAAAGSFVVPHGFQGRPVVEVTGPDGALLGVEVDHGADDNDGVSTVNWSGTLPSPATVTVTGVDLAYIPIGRAG
jgi:hypothetical protein